MLASILASSTDGREDFIESQTNPRGQRHLDEHIIDLNFSVNELRYHSMNDTDNAKASGIDYTAGLEVISD